MLGRYVTATKGTQRVLIGLLRCVALNGHWLPKPPCASIPSLVDRPWPNLFIRPLTTRSPGLTLAGEPPAALVDVIDNVAASVAGSAPCPSPTPRRGHHDILQRTR